MSIIRKAGTSALVAASLAMLAACGGGGGGTTTDTPPGSNTQAGNNTQTGNDSTSNNNNNGSTNNTVYTAPKASYAYITQRGWFNQDGSILKCKVDNGTNGNGALTECEDSGAGTLPGPISLTFVGDRAYVVNKRVGAVERVVKWEDNNYTHSIWMCSLNQADGKLSGCVNTGEKESVHIDDFFVSGKYGYMLQKYGSQILVEGYDSKTGSIGLISADTELGLNEPVNYAFIPEKNRVYIANSNSGASSVSLCTLNPNSDNWQDAVVGCVDANASTFQFNPGNSNGIQPTGVAVVGQMAYIVSHANKNVLSCSIGSDGRFTSCTVNSLGVPVDILNRVAIQDKYVYVTNTSNSANTGSLIKCEMAANGTLKSCAVTGPTFDSGDLSTSIPHNSDGPYMAIDTTGSDIKFLYPANQ